MIQHMTRLKVADNSGAREILCIQVSLPSGTGNSYQGVSTTATVEFIGEQTVNN